MDQFADILKLLRVSNGMAIGRIVEIHKSVTGIAQPENFLRHQLELPGLIAGCV
jgi:hypothetical protein